MHYLRLVFVFTLIVLAFVVKAEAQTCVLKVGAWVSLPAAENSSAVDDFNATATNQSSGEAFEATFLSGYAYFKDMPDGNYKIRIKKEGFKTTVHQHKLACGTTSAGFNILDLFLLSGSPSEVVEARPVTRVRMDRMTVVGNPDVIRRSDPPPPKLTSVQAGSTISGGVLNGKAVYLPKPLYPVEAIAARASGAVTIQVLIDESGSVIKAATVSGPELLRSAAENAAHMARFSPTTIAGVPVKVGGVIIYNFVP